MSHMTKTTPHRTLSLEKLRADLKGQVFAPSDADYDTARGVFYGKFKQRPAAIIRPADAGEVAYVVGLARETGLPLAVRGGGHSVAGHSVVEDGLVLDMRSLKAIEIDAAARTAWAQAGLTAGEYTKAAGAHGLATGFGDTATVGLGGLTLGGGIGFLVRKLGMTIDSLLAAEIVTADGKQHTVDAETHPDLFWAIRGGGGNFGVVTRFKFRLYPVDNVVGGMLILPATAEVVAGFIAAAEAAPEELSTIANLMVAPPMPFLPAETHGQLVLIALLCYAGETEAGERALAPFRALAAPLADMLRPMHYPEIYTLFGEEEGPGPVEEVARSLFMDGVDVRLAQTILDHLKASTAPLAVGQFRVLGGAMARVSNDATAFAHRQRKVMAALGAVYENPADTPAHTAWVEAFLAALRTPETGVYVNFVADEGPARVREAYPGATWDRLAAVKARYDPTNLFRRNHNIAAAQ